MTQHKAAHATKKPDAVSLTGTAIDPPSVEIDGGKSVTWTNDSKSPVSVEFPAGAAYPATSSGPIAPGSDWVHKFTDAGSYPYTVGDQKGTVVVS